ncbi:HTTM domain-containing protein [Cytophagaceae bacterium ABcell3]|nr:HTTM domain-containing protein [Cytophagaceae bacterium ABcell3]
MDVKRQIKKLCIFDLRSLAVLRVGTAFIVVLDLLLRLRDFQGHYTSGGVMPLNVLFRYLWNDYYFSFYTMASGYGFALFLFLLNLVFALVLMFGYRTRWVSIACWLMMVSLHNRNPLVLQGGDDLLRMILFWGMFLPWGRVWSLDAIKAQRITDYRVFSMAGVGYMMQTGAVYFFSALLKNSPEWTSEFTAVYYALSLDQMVYPVGKLIYPYPDLLRVLTASVWFAELLVPLLLLIPFAVSRFRLCFIILIIGLHLGISLVLNVGLFPIIGTVTLAGLLPGSIFDKGKNTIQDQLLSDHRFKQWGVSFFICVVLLGNVVSLRKFDLAEKLYPMKVANLFRIEQNWGMFAPRVFKDDGWFVLIGNEEKDIYRGGKTVSLEKPKKVYSTVPTDRWRKYQENILLISNSHFRPYYCNYLMNYWNSRNDDKITNLKVVYMKEVTLPNYEVEGPSYELLYECSCQ